MVTGGCLVLSGCSRERRGSSTAEVPGGAVVQNSMTGGISTEVLKTMRWEDVALTAEACARNRLSDPVLEHSAGLSEAPSDYLRGLLELSLSHPDRAHSERSRLDPAAMPPDFLYAPWRLAATQAGGNRFAAALAAAVKEGRTGALVTARWHAADADWAVALETYLRTDPAGWSPHEVEQFRMMKLNSPTERETDQLMAGALRAGRVPQSLRGDLARLIKGAPKPDKDALAAALKSNPAFAAAATEAASRQLALRQAFASNRFAEVVEKIRDADPPPAEPRWSTALVLGLLILLPFTASSIGPVLRGGDSPPAGLMAGPLEPGTWLLRLTRQAPNIVLTWHAPSGSGRHHTLPVCLSCRSSKLHPEATCPAVFADGELLLAEAFLMPDGSISAYDGYLHRTLLPFTSAGVHLIASARRDSMEAADFELAAKDLFSRIATRGSERHKLADIPQSEFQFRTHP